MKKIASFMVTMAFIMPAIAVAPIAQGRRSIAGQMAASSRQTASQNQIAAMAVTATTTNDSTTVDKPSVHIEPELPHVTNNRDREKAACLNNNIGIGNTFVWASKYSNTDNYASMVEDVNNPENNTCFVRVEVSSSDPRINTSDFAPKYFEWGTNITCASWIDEELLKKRILDAKKSARTWATVGGTVGGAGLGFATMELVGNRLIGGKLEGQYSLDDSEMIRSQIMSANGTERSKMVSLVEQLRDACQKANNTTAAPCKYKFDMILSGL